MQFERVTYVIGDEDVDQLFCSPDRCGLEITKFGLYGYQFRYYRPNPSTGLTRPGGQWKFSVAPEIVVSAAPVYFQSALTWQPGADLPVNQATAANTDFMWGGACGSVTTYAGRNIEFAVTLRLPDGTSLLLARDSTQVPVVLRSSTNWELRCIAGGSPRFVLYSPQGVRFEMGQESRASAFVSSARWQATRADDLRTNAWLKYIYDTQNPTFVVLDRVEASDGRWLQLSHDHSYDGSPVSLAYPSFLRPANSSVTPVELPVEPTLKTAATALATWTYEYNSPTLDSPILNAKGMRTSLPSAKRSLKRVILPESGGAWAFAYGEPWNPDIVSHRGAANVGDQQLLTLTEPTGGVVTYQMEFGPAQMYALLPAEKAWRVLVGTFCSPVRLKSGYYDPACLREYMDLQSVLAAGEQAVRTHSGLRIHSRSATTASASSDGGTWVFEYERSAVEGQFDTTTVTEPGGYKRTYEHYGEKYFKASTVPSTGVASPAATNDAWAVGLLYRNTQYQDQTKTVKLSEKTFDWAMRQYGAGPFWLRGSNWHVDDAKYAAQLVGTKSVNDGVAMATSYADITLRGSPQTISQYGPNELGVMNRRVQSVTYHTDEARSLIEIPKDETTTHMSSGTLQTITPLATTNSGRKRIPATNCASNPALCQ